MSAQFIGSPTNSLDLGDIDAGASLIEGGSALSTDVSGLDTPILVDVQYVGSNPPADAEAQASSFSDDIVAAINIATAASPPAFGPVGEIIGQLASAGFEVQFGADAGNGEIIELMFDFSGFYPASGDGDAGSPGGGTGGPSALPIYATDEGIIVTNEGASAGGPAVWEFSPIDRVNTDAGHWDGAYAGLNNPEEGADENVRTIQVTEVSGAQNWAGFTIGDQSDLSLATPVPLSPDGHTVIRS